MWRETCQFEKEQKTVKTYFLKVLLIDLDNIEANHLCQRTTRLFMADSLSNELHEKVNDMLLKVDHMYILLRKLPWSWLLTNQ